MNEIVLRRKNKIWVEKGTANQPETRMIFLIRKKYEENLGFTFSEKLTERLMTLTKEELGAFYFTFTPLLEKRVAADKTYTPMYVNFPNDVKHASDWELVINALLHYLSGGVIYPDGKEELRLPSMEPDNPIVLDLGGREDIEEIFSMLCTSKTALSVTDMEDISHIFKQISGISLPDEIVLKENAALIGKLYLEMYPLAKAEDIQKYMKTATDVLRLITAMSDGDISLANNCKYRSFKRRERRILMDLLAGCGNIEEDMVRYLNRWIRVGERLHPSEYKVSQYDAVRTAFDKIRNKQEIWTFNSSLERALKEKNVEKACLLLKKRAGEMARRLDKVLRLCEHPEQEQMVLQSWSEVAAEVSTPVLLQVREHFKERSALEGEKRFYFAKSKVAKVSWIPEVLPPMKPEVAQRVVQICEEVLVMQYAEKEPLGNVYLSEEFKQYLVPYSQRSASKAIKTIVRGSKLPISSDTKAVRAFIWWTNVTKNDREQRVDIDLSVAVFDSDWKKLTHVSYTRLYDKNCNMYHSGDIVNGGEEDGAGVAEFLDVDIDSIIAQKGRYLVYQVYSFTAQKFSELPNCRFGWMERMDVNSGEIFEPKTVKQSMDLTAESIVAVPVIFDCVERQFIWCDVVLSLNESVRLNNLESNIGRVGSVCYAMTHLKKPNLYDLISLHIQARGMKVETKDEADIIFDVDEGITPYQTEYIQAELL